MRLRKNIFRATTFTLVGVFGIGAIFAVNSLPQEETTAVSGSWANFVSTAWMNDSDARYKNYTETPGSSESSPYLIKTAEEFSGIRAFESGSALAGKYMMLANDIDLSAHYWDPIELYGAGDSEDDMYNIDYSNDNWLSGDEETVHFDGNSVKITGMVVDNVYDQVLIYANEPWGDYAWPVEAGSTGLFSFAYKARIANVNLVSPKITLSETSGIEATGDLGWREIDVMDVAGTIVGASHNSRVINTHVSDPQIDYTASFGEAIDDNDYHYAPSRIMVGGMVGYAFGQTVASNSSIKGGAINVAPIVNETLIDDEGDIWMGSLDEGGVAVGGIVGFNYQSVVLSTCNGSDISFTDAGYTLNSNRGNEVEKSFALNSYQVAVGGIVGNSSTQYSFQACIYNSCAHSTLSVRTTQIGESYTGGIVGVLADDSMINNYFDGNFASTGMYVGEIVGGLYTDPADGYVIASNYYLDRGTDPYGTSYEASYGGFGVITTTAKLTDDLNAGRQAVIKDSFGHAAGELSEEFLESQVATWAIQDGSHPLDCVGSLKVGLVSPNTESIVVPDTGAK
ncbi:MAG: hypothetical protein ACK5MU_01280 [Candidatus Saccharimonadales bacterium]